MTERVVALALLLASGGYVVYALQFSLGSQARPGPGFFPVAIGAFGALVALGWVAQAVRRAPAASAAAVERTSGGTERVASTAGLLVLFCLLFPYAGYPAMAFIFVAGLLRRLRMSWPVAIAIGLVSAVASYQLFAVLLGVPLPRGLWFD
jgi:hypothetical protein